MFVTVEPRHSPSSANEPIGLRLSGVKHSVSGRAAGIILHLRQVGGGESNSAALHHCRSSRSTPLGSLVQPCSQGRPVFSEDRRDQNYYRQPKAQYQSIYDATSFLHDRSCFRSCRGRLRIEAGFNPRQCYLSAARAAAIAAILTMSSTLAPVCSTCACCGRPSRIGRMAVPPPSSRSSL